MRPVLRPGTHVLRRDPRELQVGLDPRHAVVLPDDHDTRSSLELLNRSADAREYDGRDALDLLRTHGLLLDAGCFLPLLPSCEADQVSDRGVRPTARPMTRHDVAALARAAGDGTAALLGNRKSCRVDVLAFADTEDKRLEHALLEMLRETGVRARRWTARPRSTTPPGSAPSTSAGPPEMAALVGVGEPRRDLADAWMREGVPHVLVRLTEGSATVGPFVVPGRTACLRCLDAHHTDADPSWPLLVAQYASLRGRDRADGVPEPVDSSIATVALAWAARDLTSYAENRRPSTWSTTIRFDPHLTSIETRAWLRHPECGCAWG